MKGNLKEQLKQYYKTQSVNPSKAHLAQTVQLCQAAYHAGRKHRRIGYLPFLLRQLGWMEKKIFIVQGIAMLLAVLLLYQTGVTGSLYRTYPVFLGGCGILFALINVPFLRRSFHYNMLEIELSTCMSLPRLLLARLIVIGAANLLAMSLVGVLGASWAVTAGIPVWSTAVFVFLPYLLACIGCVCMINISRGRLGTGYSILLCGALFGVLFLLTKQQPELFLELYITVWWLACIPALAILAAALRSMLKRGKSLDKIRI